VEFFEFLKKLRLLPNEFYVFEIFPLLGDANCFEKKKLVKKKGLYVKSII